MDVVEGLGLRPEAAPEIYVALRERNSCLKAVDKDMNKNMPSIRSITVEYPSTLLSVLVSFFRAGQAEAIAPYI